MNDGLAEKFIELAINNPYIFITIALFGCIWWFLSKVLTPIMYEIVNMVKEAAKAITDSVERIEKAVSDTMFRADKSNHELNRVDKKLNIIYRAVDKEKVYENEYESI